MSFRCGRQVEAHESIGFLDDWLVGSNAANASCVYDIMSAAYGRMDSIACSSVRRV